MIKRFLSYVEIRTKVTSVFAFFMTLAYLLYKGQKIKWRLTWVFFAAMFVFDLTTTAINNYIDTKTNHQALQFERKTAKLIIFVLFFISTALGLYLAYMTDAVVLLVGALCFMCGILYTWGPIPISRQPLGEVLSGLFYGLFIPFLMLYINMPSGTYVLLSFDGEAINISLKLNNLLSVLLLAAVPFCTTANIMLANNICDLQKDLSVKRYTLPHYIGDKALYLFALLYYTAYIAIVVMAALGILSPICLLSLFTLLLVQRNISSFFRRQEKATTFHLSVQNYITIMGSLTILIFISVLFK